jgi:high-affinity iron transporter
MASEIFSLKVFFVLLRETFESAIVISILLSFLKQNFTTNAARADVHRIHVDAKVYRSLQLQVWIGALLGLSICLAIGAVFIALFYMIGENYWSKYERIWEAVFSVLSSLIISVMGLSLLRINTMQRKWQAKLSKGMAKQFENNPTGVDDAEAVDQLEHELDCKKKSGIKAWFKKYAEKYSLMVLPMVTLLREGLEAIFVISGVSASEPVSSLPLSIILAFTIGTVIGVFLYKGGNKMKLQLFLIGSTCFLYMVSAGLMSRGVWFFELEQYVQRCHGQDMTEIGDGPGSYDIVNTVWHVNCCSGVNDGGWMLLNALVGWQNTATFGSILSYWGYWAFVIFLLKIKLFQERHGYIPFIPIKWQLRKILKRYHIIKYNLENNVTYAAVQSDVSEYNSIGVPPVIDDSGVDVINENDSTPLTGLIA